MQTFSGKLYTTEADIRRAVGAMVPGLNDGTLYSPSLQNSDLLVVFDACRLTQSTHLCRPTSFFRC